MSWHTRQEVCFYELARAAKAGERAFRRIRRSAAQSSAVQRLCSPRCRNLAVPSVQKHELKTRLWQVRKSAPGLRPPLPHLHRDCAHWPALRSSAWANSRVAKPTWDCVPHRLLHADGVPTQGGKADVAFVTAALARYTASIPSSVPRGSDIVTPSTSRGPSVSAQMWLGT